MNEASHLVLCHKRDDRIVQIGCRFATTKICITSGYPQIRASLSQ